MIDPVFFRIGSRPIYWYGVAVALGFLAAVAHWTMLGPREGRPRGFGSDLGFLIMVSGIAGARIAYVIANASHYAANPLEIVRIDQGGLIFYGGFLAACAAVLVMALRRRESPLALGDFAVSAVPLGHAIGRVGCFLNSCCYGSPSDVPWHTYCADALRHPVQLYEAAFNMALYVFLLRLYPRRPRQGCVVAAYLMLYGTWRFLIEFLRGDERAHWLGLSVAQDLSVLLVAAGAILWFAARPARASAHA